MKEWKELKERKTVKEQEEGKALREQEEPRKLELRLLKQYREYLLGMEKSLATIDKYLRDIRTFDRWLGEDKRISKEQIIAYKAWLQENYKTSSANSMLVALNSFLTWLGEAGNRVKTIRVQQQMFRDRGKEMSREEYRRLIAAAYKEGQEQTGLFMETIASTGIRVSELKYITVEAARRGYAEVCCKGKRRQVYLVKELQKKLLQYCRKKDIRAGSIFISRYGNPLDRSNIWARMKAVGKKAGIAPEKVFPHNLRHLFARVFWAKWKDIFYLADILGHSNVNTTRIYTVTTGENHRRRLQSLGLIA